MLAAAEASAAQVAGCAAGSFAQSRVTFELGWDAHFDEALPKLLCTRSWRIPSHSYADFALEYRIASQGWHWQATI